MKKMLLISKLMLVFLLFTAWNVSAQDYYFSESFATGNTPDGWEVKDVSYSDGSQAANQLDTTARFSAKMKTNNLTSWIKFPKVNGVTDLAFWCKVRDPQQNPIVAIQSSPDGTTWTDVISSTTGIAGLDLTNTSDFQEVTIPLNVDGEVFIRLYVSADGGTSSKGMLYVDDIRLGKPAAAIDDVTLFSLSVDSSIIDGFDFNVTAYAMEVSHAMGYTVTAEANNPNATVEITQVSDINGDEAARTATILVTGEDGTSTATTTIVFTITDYWYKEGFNDNNDLDGWDRHGVFQTSNIKVEPLNAYEGEEAIKFTRGHETGSTGDHGYLLTPKLTNVGTLTFWVAAETVNSLHGLFIYIKTSDSDSTEVFSLEGDALTVAWQEVEVVINETTDSIQIKIEGICDINDASDSRIWMDDFLLTYYNPEFGPDDVSLSYINVGGILIEGFDSDVTTYAMEVSIIADITVSAEANNQNATVDITQASDIKGDEAARTATILVTSEDGTVTSTITIVFSLPLNVTGFTAPEVSFYPNPATDMLNIKIPEKSYERLEIYNMSGQKIRQEIISSDQVVLNISGLSKGFYVLSFTGVEGSFKAKLIKE